ncbi:hypothetical protein ASPVEDRAFT_30312 [Aspergillus versicolor CBS 583.65]|uniref:REJ domain-containing protein n=1 Tax=Aspergillus versicolor CBS 583.65 TaxID=1036611 RepID=A0A1L9PQL1_ASPVE|nr:uncharacterized protein ASPVEDRAFT_30312 [Aspergillus versicolor CBS 583.65]OJJ03817.1 hypothetical protein ASPVEDRAFT_30312 [Aspergillus versicolor CBS 583.65]
MPSTPAQPNATATSDTDSTENTPSPTPTESEPTSPSETPTSSEEPTSSSSTESTSSTETTESTSTTQESPTPTSTATTTTTTDESTSSTTDEPTSSTDESTSSAETSPETTTTVVTVTGSTTTSTITDGDAASTIGSSSTASATDTDGGGSGLSAGGTIAVAVVVPVASVAIIVLLGLWLWRRHKAKKVAEEERRKEVEEYGFNPNGDPTLPAVMGGGADDNSGYRGWGTTSAGRKASTNLSSSAGVGLAMSEAGSQPGYQHAATPSDGTIQYSEGHGGLGETEPYGILGAAPVAGAATSNQRNVDINRGPSNASSAYSAANHSDISEESHMSAAHPGGPYYDYTDAQQPYGGYSDPYGGQPVIRDVQARRNTQIQNPSVFPRQGNAGIAQNF